MYCGHKYYFLGLHKHLWQGLAYCIVISVWGAPCVGGLGGCFLWRGRNQETSSKATNTTGPPRERWQYDKLDPATSVCAAPRSNTSVHTTFGNTVFLLIIYMHSAIANRGLMHRDLYIITPPHRYTWFVSKVSVLVFYLIIYCTYLKLQVISFEVWPLGSYTAVPTFLPLVIAVPEVIFRKCFWVIGYSFLYVFYHPEMMTLQLQFQLREEVEIARS